MGCDFSKESGKEKEPAYEKPSNKGADPSLPQPTFISNETPGNNNQNENIPAVQIPKDDHLPEYSKEPGKEEKQNIGNNEITSNIGLRKNSQRRKSKQDKPHKEEAKNEPEATFQCDVCPSPTKFKLESDLKLHMQTHSQDKPFKCNKGCGEAFAQKRSCMRHEATCRGT